MHISLVSVNGVPLPEVDVFPDPPPAPSDFFNGPPRRWASAELCSLRFGLELDNETGLFLVCWLNRDEEPAVKVFLASPQVAELASAETIDHLTAQALPFLVSRGVRAMLKSRTATGPFTLGTEDEEGVREARVVLDSPVPLTAAGLAALGATCRRVKDEFGL